MERVTSTISQLLEPTTFPEQRAEDVESDHAGNAEEDGVPLKPTATSLSLVAPVLSKPVREIPNGGLKAWLQVVGTFFVLFNTWGVTNAYGVFVIYYSSGYLNASDSNISIVGAVQAFFLLASAFITGPLFDMGYLYHLMFVGTFLTVFGMMMTSLCTQYSQVLLAQGLCIGFGSGCLFVPSVAVLATYFTTKRLLATGIAASGSSVGAIVYPLLFYYLQPTIGYPWAVRIIGFVMLATLSVTLATMKVRMATREGKKIFDMAAMKDLPFLLFCMALFVGFGGIYISFFFITNYTLATTHASSTVAFYVLVIMNATSIFGRVLPGFVADRLGPLNVLAPAGLVAAILIWCWIPAKELGGIIAFAALFGFFSGSFVSLPPMTTVTLSPTLNAVGARLGIAFACAGAGLLLGEPVAGAILAGSGSYVGIQAFSAACTTVAALLLIATRLLKTGPKLVAKA